MDRTGGCPMVRILSAAVLGLFLGLTGCDSGAAESAANSTPAAVSYSQWQVAVTGDIVKRTPYDGQVVPAQTLAVQSAAAGTITRLPAVGSAVHAGDPLFYVDEGLVVAMPGEIPMYRDLVALAAGPALSGNDVQQLQTFLTRAGYFSGTVNGLYSSYLGTVIRSWRLDHDMSDAPGFTKSELVFIAGDGPWTVTGQVGMVGQAFAGGEVVDVSTGDLAVTVSLDTPPPAGVAYAVVPAAGAGGPEIPLMPKGAAAPAEDGTYVQVLTAGALPAGATLTLGTSVVVEQSESLATAVVTVPVAAIRLDASGSTIVECRADEAAAASSCPVQLGASDGINVEITSGLDAGEEVAVAP